MKTGTNILLNKLLFRNTSKGRLAIAWFTLLLGCSLLLIAITVWWDFQEILGGKQSDNGTYSYLVINKESNSFSLTGFSEEEIAALKTAPQVADVGALQPASFSVYISAGGSLGFSTMLPLQAVPERFIDKLPPNWSWNERDIKVPVIVPHEFLNQYNFVFAPSQGLPQLSEASVRNLSFQVSVANQQNYIGHVVGFSDRIQSVLVPEAFIKYNNDRYGNPAGGNQLAQLILKVQDPSKQEFTQYLKDHHYDTNDEQLRWSKMRDVVSIAGSITGLLALLLISLSLIAFQLFIELTISRVKDNIVLLLQTGYSPKTIRKFWRGKFLPFLGGAVCLAVILTVACQYVLYLYAKKMAITIAALPGYPMLLAAILCGGFLFYRTSATIKKSLR